MVTRQSLLFAWDCVRFLWELALGASRWAALTLAIYGFGVVWLARLGTAADAETLGLMLINDSAKTLTVLGGLSLIALGMASAITATPPFRLPPRWRAWIDEHNSQLETRVEARWAKIPSHAQKRIIVALLLVLIGALGALFWFAPPPSIEAVR